MVSTTSGLVRGGDGDLIDTDIIFNPVWNYDAYDGHAELPFLDFRRVTAHELGHAIGLGHSKDQDAIMWPIVSERHALAEDDVKGAQAIYGHAPSYDLTLGVDGFGVFIGSQCTWATGWFRSYTPSRFCRILASSQKVVCATLFFYS